MLPSQNKVPREAIPLFQGGMLRLLPVAVFLSGFLISFIRWDPKAMKDLSPWETLF